MSKISRPRTTRSGPTARERRGSPSAHVDRRAASRSTEGNAQSHREDEAPLTPQPPPHSAGRDGCDSEGVEGAPAPPHSAGARLRICGRRGKRCPIHPAGRSPSATPSSSPRSDGKKCSIHPAVRARNWEPLLLRPIIRERRPSPRSAGARFAEHSLDTTDNHHPVAKGARRTVSYTHLTLPTICSV